MTLENRLILDGIDLYTAFKCFTAENGYKSLVQFPKSKNIYTNDWHEIDGIEADLSNPLPETRTVSLDLYTHDKKDAQTLAAWLANRSPLHSFKFRLDNTRTYTLRLNSVSGVTVLADQLAKVTLQLIEDDMSYWDNVVRTYIYIVQDYLPMPSYTLYHKKYQQPDYVIDGVRFTWMGFNVLAGTDATIYKAGNVKENLKTVLGSVSGTAEYDAIGDVHFKNRDIVLKLVAHTADLATFNQIMNILYCMLMRPGARQFYFGKLDRTFPCYYKSSSVSKIIIRDSGETWCELSVTLGTLKDTPQAYHDIPSGRAFSSGFSVDFL